MQQRYVATVTAQTLLEEARGIQGEKDVEAFVLKVWAGAQARGTNARPDVPPFQ